MAEFIKKIFQSKILGECLIIFVTVGLHSKGFDRLIKKMDDIAGEIDEKVIIQIGSTKYIPKNAEYFDFIDIKSLTKLIKEARIIVCHGGAGTIITSLELKKPVIAVPRLKKFNESIDDHQFELIDALAKDGKILTVKNIDQLGDVIKNIDQNKIEIEMERGQLISALKNYISTLEK